MAQQFQRDAQAAAAAVTVVTTAETAIVTTNFVNAPFGTFKAVGLAVVFFTPGTATTSVQLRIRRNPTGDNTVVANQTIVAGFTVGSLGVVLIAFTDAVPDGRAVQYQVTVTQAAATGNGTAAAGSYIDATLLSG